MHVEGILCHPSLPAFPFPAFKPTTRLPPPPPAPDLGDGHGLAGRGGAVDQGGVGAEGDLAAVGVRGDCSGRKPGWACGNGQGTRLGCKTARAPCAMQCHRAEPEGCKGQRLGGRGTSLLAWAICGWAACGVRCLRLCIPDTAASKRKDETCTPMPAASCICGAAPDVALSPTYACMPVRASVKAAAAHAAGPGRCRWVETGISLLGSSGK